MNFGGRDKPAVLQFQLSWDRTKEQARMNAHDQWRHMAAPAAKDDTATPQQFDAACAYVTPQQMDNVMLVAADAAEIVADIKEYEALGFDEIYFHNAGRNQSEYIQFFGQHIFARFKRVT